MLADHRLAVPTEYWPARATPSVGARRDGGLLSYFRLRQA
jgi:hypothetical protein